MNRLDSAICIVDDDPSVREALESLLRAEGMRTETYATGDEFLQRPHRQQVPGCLILDVEMPGLNGFDLQDRLVGENAGVPIIFLTGNGSIPLSVRAIKAGAMEFLTKPFDADELIKAVREGLRERQTDCPPSDGFIGNSPALRKVIQQIELIAPTNATVLVTGESGTGKELVARAIHERSPRKERPLIKVNCGAVPDSLFESEFFGHARGAFTGALRDKPGRFEMADGGTLFLDEIGEIPLAMQAKFLRVLQEQEVERIGEMRTRQLNVRIIAATNRDLKTEVESGRFRADLFYRLSVFPLQNPPLRERSEDIPALAEHFIRAVSRRLDRRPPKLSPAATRLLASHPWPGNIRELQNTIERAVILSRHGVLELDELVTRSFPQPDPPALTGTEAPFLSRGELKQRERQSIIAALAQSGGKVSGVDGAAALLGMKPTTLYSRIIALGLSRKNQDLLPAQ